MLLFSSTLNLSLYSISVFNPAKWPNFLLIKKFVLLNLLLSFFLFIFRELCSLLIGLWFLNSSLLLSLLYFIFWWRLFLFRWRIWDFIRCGLVNLMGKLIGVLLRANLRLESLMGVDWHRMWWKWLEKEGFMGWCLLLLLVLLEDFWRKNWLFSMCWELFQVKSV